jgi:hypothetical protein
MKQDFSGGLGSNMQGKMDELRKPAMKETPKAGMGGEEKTHTISEHADGHLTSHMHDGTETEHPDHLHMLAHIGHHVSGGDKHHIAHHDGMSAHTHAIDESGQHTETQEKGSGEEAGQDCAAAMGGEEGEESHGAPQEEQQSAPLGGM